MSLDENELRKSLTLYFQNIIENQNTFDRYKQDILNLIENQKRIDNKYKQDALNLIENANKYKQNNLSSIINYAPQLINDYSLSISANKIIDELEKEIKEKENHNKILLAEVKQLKVEKQDITIKLDEIVNNQLIIQKRERLLRLTSKIHPNAANIIQEKDEPELLNKFFSEDESNNVIMSIDIRRSTDLMLNANCSDDFALFITGLCEGLKQIVIANFGVFDKFTGDGILAYFPIFYSGEDAIQRCCKTAQLCHVFFTTYYKEKRDKFKINLKTGLGIGIDYGAAKLVRVNDEPTIVGIPVVYACRLSSAPFGHTYINQPAFQNLKGKDIKINEIDVEIKNQGIVTVYDLIDIEITNLKEPDWFSMPKEVTQEKLQRDGFGIEKCDERKEQ
jgi:class 3 adenylate cyclase